MSGTGVSSELAGAGGQEPAHVTGDEPAAAVGLPYREALQRRSLRVLVGSQVLGGAGLGAGITVGALLAEDVLGSTRLSGLPAALGGVGIVLAAVLDSPACCCSACWSTARAPRRTCRAGTPEATSPHRSAAAPRSARYWWPPRSARWPAPTSSPRWASSPRAGTSRRWPARSCSPH
jgi:hypothetical protein